jgi:hypothetical protein
MAEISTTLLFSVSTQGYGDPEPRQDAARRSPRCGRRGRQLRRAEAQRQLARPDGALQLDVRLTLKTDDGEIIGMNYRGFRHGPAAVIERLNRGEIVDPSEYYFRTAPFFETASEKYGWLNRIVTVATGHRLPDGPVYHVFEVL